MIEFPEFPPEREPPVRKMTLREYTHFSERCLKSNPAITPENCLEKRAREKAMVRPFVLRATS
jgi:hypothetical protein